MKEKILDVIVAGVCTVAGILGGWDLFLKALLGLMVIDFLVGVFQIRLDGWDSNKFFNGGIRKTIILCSVAGLVLIEPVLGVPYIRDYACTYWALRELRSVLATGERFGVEPFILLNNLIESGLEKINNLKK